jgi:hypothetical protein
MTKFDLSLCFALPQEAAAEIERLTAENERLMAALRDIATPGDEDRDLRAVAECALDQQVTLHPEGK